MERQLKGYTKAVFTQKANSVGRRTVGIFTTVMTTMTVYIFHKLVYQNTQRYFKRYLRKIKKMKVGIFTIMLVHLNNYLSYINFSKFYATNCYSST